MKMKTLISAMLISLMISLTAPTYAQPISFADPAFKALWNRTDLGVAGGNAGRSWPWGPGPLSAGLREPYAQSPGGTRLVQYFEKARMEINTPDADRPGLWFVTNGLLPIEMITGQVQVGDGQFEARAPAIIPAIGDPDNSFPTYADLALVFTRQGTGDQIGNPITGRLNPDRTISGYDAYRSDSSTWVAAVEQQHGIPAAFLDYMNAQSGDLGRTFVFGLPVSGAYWVQARVMGRELPVMFQVFERRLLTYTPANPPAFRTESGNVGLHYLRWRYSTPEVTVEPSSGPAGTTFTVHVSGLPPGETATATISPAPFDSVIRRTIVGDTGEVTFPISTTIESSQGLWGVAVTRTALSPAIQTVVRFEVTAP